MATTKRSANNGTNTKMNHQFSTRIDIDSENRAQVIEILNQALAETLDLYTQTKHAHWNVKGENFYQLHLLFDELAEMIFPYIDELGERITALGGFAKGTVRMAVSGSELPEFPEVNGGMEFVRALADRYGELGNRSREAIDKTDQLEDMASSDLMTEIVRGLDKALYFLEGHLRQEES